MDEELPYNFIKLKQEEENRKHRESRRPRQITIREFNRLSESIELSVCCSVTFCNIALFITFLILFSAFKSQLFDEIINILKQKEVKFLDVLANKHDR